MSTKIRNIMQSVQGREIIKTAPDMVVYIDGLPFFPNPYLKGDSAPYVTVNFNDYITATSFNYGVDNLIPSGSISLSIPNGSKYLFLAPGGGFMLQPMSEIKVYAKSYFFSKNKNSLYKRVFNGMIKAVDYNETNTSLEVSISCVGIMRWLELMQTDLHPALLSNSSSGAVAERTIESHLNPYQILANVFRRALDFSGFLTSSFFEDLVKYGVNKDSLVNWQKRLDSLKKYIHIFGYTNQPADKPATDTKIDKGKTTGKIKKAEVSIAEQENKLLTSLINQHLPEMSIGSINILDSSNITSRLERLRQVIESMGYEGFQDLDGSIIIKPPIYNLDSTIIGDTSLLPKETNLTSETNPFIINLSEILGENYMEDEAGIRRTRMTVTGSFFPSGYQLNVAQSLRSVASFIDVNLVRKYGVRDEPPKTLTFLGDNNSVSFAFAAMELAKANKNARTYHVTIPMRPELRLGFPIFLPHLDMYAYITAISLSYNVGGRADMSLTCNYIRKRPQRAIAQIINGKNAIVYTSQPNLVHAVTPKGKPATQPTPSTGSGAVGGAMNMVAGLNAIPAIPSEGLSDTLLNPMLPSANDTALGAYIQNKAGSIFETAPDTNTDNWRIQEDINKVFDGEYDPKTQKKTVRPQDKKYIENIQKYQPYTDEKGYEVISPFAWGRYSSLSDAIFSFTSDKKSSLTNTQDTTAVFTTSSAFVYAGLAVPINTGSAATLNDQIVKDLITSDASNITSFELDFSNSLMTPKQLEDNAVIQPNISSTNLQSYLGTGTANSQVTINSPDLLQKAQVFLDGVTTDLSNYMSGGDNSQSGTSTLPQNTDLGTYLAPGESYAKINYALNPQFTTTQKNTLG